MKKQEIIYAIMKHLELSRKSSYSDFYVGLTSDITERLFNAHGVPDKGIGTYTDMPIRKISLVK